jgi:hypothetical protein
MMWEKGPCSFFCMWLSSLPNSVYWRDCRFPIVYSFTLFLLSTLLETSFSNLPYEGNLHLMWHPWVGAAQTSLQWRIVWGKCHLLTAPCAIHLGSTAGFLQRPHSPTDCSTQCSGAGGGGIRVESLLPDMGHLWRIGFALGSASAWARISQSCTIQLRLLFRPPPFPCPSTEVRPSSPCLLLCPFILQKCLTPSWCCLSRGPELAYLAMKS